MLTYVSIQALKFSHFDGQVKIIKQNNNNVKAGIILNMLSLA